MDQKTLLLFANRIFKTSSEGKAILSLCQLKTLLEEQGGLKADMDLLDKMIQSLPEMKQVSQKEAFDAADVEIAFRRAQLRRQREEAARYRGRC